MSPGARRTGIRRTVAPAVALALALAGCAALGDDGATPPDEASAPPDTVPVSRGDLVETTTTSGRLGYGETRDLVASAAGTVTWLPPAGRVVRNGGSLYRLDDEPVLRLTGRVPAWRDLGPEVADGADVRQLESALRALGHTDGLDLAVDGDWTWVTTIAVERWQEDLGLEETGTLPLGRVVFTPGPLRVSETSVALGAQVQPGTPVLAVGGTERSVTLELEATQKHLAPVDGKVDLVFPDGTDARGRIETVEHVAGDEATEEHLAVTVEVLRRDASRKAVAGQLEGTSVQVRLRHVVATDVLTVPVTALVALTEGGYGVEVVSDGGDGTSYLAVDTGAFADTDVEVRSPQLREGTVVVVSP